VCDDGHRNTPVCARRVRGERRLLCRTFALDEAFLGSRRRYRDERLVVRALAAWIARARNVIPCLLLAALRGEDRDASLRRRADSMVPVNARIRAGLPMRPTVLRRGHRRSGWLFARDSSAVTPRRRFKRGGVERLGENNPRRPRLIVRTAPSMLPGPLDTKGTFVLALDAA